MIQYPYPIQNSYCCNKPHFHTICIYCICPNYKTFLQMDWRCKKGELIHLQSQTYKFDEQGKLDKTYCCHCHYCYWLKPPSTEQFNCAFKLAEYAILKPQK